MPDTVVFVAGGTGGLGSAICRQLADEGRSVFFTYRSRTGTAEELRSALAAAGTEIGCCRLDLRSGDEVACALSEAARIGVVDAVVYAAGPAIPQRWFSLITPEDWRWAVTGELEGFFNLVHAALPRLRAAGGGSIIATTSFATGRVIPGDVLSAVPKAGIEMLIRQIAREEGRYGVRANCVAPGIVDAGLGLATQRDHYTPELWSAQRKSVPLRRFGTADDVAGAVSYLLSARAAYINGQTIAVDGGMSA